MGQLAKGGDAGSTPRNLDRTARTFQRLPEYFVQELAPIFDEFVDVRNIRVLVLPVLPEGNPRALHLGGHDIAIRESVFNEGRATVLSEVAHETVHVVQERLLGGRETFRKLLTLEYQTTGSARYQPVGVPRTISGIRNTNFLSRRTLEGIAERIEDLTYRPQFLPVR